MFTTQISTVGCVAVFATTSIVLGDMTGLSYDIVGEDLVVGTYTVRVYAELETGNRLNAVFGNDTYNLRLDYLGGATPWHQLNGGPTSMSIDPNAFGAHPSLEWDSFVTIGALDQTDNELGEIGFDWSSWEGGGNLFADNAAFWVLSPNPQGEPIDGRVLVAQLTTTTVLGGQVYFTGGFQWRDSDGMTHQSSHNIMIPAPGAIALLGLAGLAGQRRRRRIA
jgi:uncharacterized protein (TIGR03382 family)